MFHSRLATPAAFLILSCALVAFATPAVADLPACAGVADIDADGIADCVDNCPTLSNDQSDADGDGIGDVCDCDVVVDTFDDGDDGECLVDCTLREAIEAAATFCTLELSPGSYSVTLGALDVQRSVTIRGAGADSTYIDSSLDLFLDELAFTEVWIGGVTLEGGVGARANQVPIDVTLNSCRLRSVEVGSAVCCVATNLTLDHCIVEGHDDATPAVVVAAGEAGTNRLTAIDTVIAGSRGGAMVVQGAFHPLNTSGGVATLRRCSIRDNSGPATAGIRVTGGGLSGRPGGFLTLEDSTIRDGVAAGDGGALRVDAGTSGGRPGFAQVTNSTLSGNVAANGAGIYNGGEVILESVTIAGNHATGSGGGVLSETSGLVELHGTIVSGNDADLDGPDCHGLLSSNGDNLVGDLAECSVLGSPVGNLLGVDPLLGPLGDNGGPTRTHRPLAASSVIDAGDDCPAFDQRGVPRPGGDDCDIGAVEIGPDADGDGVEDVLDGCPADPDKSEPEVCGCGTPDVDGDGDGVPDCIDGCPQTPGQVDPGLCGCGQDVDSDDVCTPDDNCPSIGNPLQIDSDGDGSGAACDCDDDDATTWPGAAEVNDGLDNQCPGDPGHGVVDETTGVSGFLDPADRDAYSWPAQSGASKYEVARSTLRDFSAGCASFVTGSTAWIDSTIPATGVVLHYLNRPVAPFVGSWGKDSSGVERTAICP